MPPAPFLWPLPFSVVCSAVLLVCFSSFNGAIRPVGLSSDGLTLFSSPIYLLVAFAMFLASSTQPGLSNPASGKI